MFHHCAGYSNSLQFLLHSVLLIIHSEFHLGFTYLMSPWPLTPYYISKKQVKTILTHVNSVTNVSKAYSKEQLTRANEVRRLNYALLHPADAVLIKALKYILLGTRLTAQDVYLYRLIFGACPCCLFGKTISPSYTTSLSPSALMPGHIGNVDLIPFPEICLGDIQYHLLVCDEFSSQKGHE